MKPIQIKKPGHGTLCMAGIGMLVAFVLTWQFRSVLDAPATDRTALARAEQLQTELIEEREKNEVLYNQLLQYKDDLAALTSQAEDAGGYAAVLSGRLTEAQLLAGITAVTGPGVTVTLSDSDAVNTGTINENYFVIHDQDLLLVINELRDAGAEAISLNGERLISTSEIRCTGATVSVNGRRYAAPYTIQAIGNAKELSDALTMRGGQVETLAIWGIKCDIVKETSITLAGYSGTTTFQYASAADTGGEK